MRAAGIPSRSVNGYLGGEWNEFGGYLVVRQQHAHSWSRLTCHSGRDRRRTRTAPAIVPGSGTAPGIGTDRSQRGPGAGLPYAWQTLDPTPLSALSPARFGFLQRARRFSDSLEMSWNKYVLEYDPRAQRHLAERMSGLFGVARRAARLAAPQPASGGALCPPAGWCFWRG